MDSQSYVIPTIWAYIAPLEIFNVLHLLAYTVLLIEMKEVNLHKSLWYCYQKEDLGHKQFFVLAV